MFPFTLWFGLQGTTMFLLGPRGRIKDERVHTTSGLVELLYPFFDIVHADRTAAQALCLRREKVEVPLHRFRTGQALAVCKPLGPKRALSADIPFWTNAHALRIGDRLYAEATVLASEEDSGATS